MVRILGSSILMACCSLVAFGQAAHSEFEVASIKVHPMAPNSFMFRRYDHVPPFVKLTSNRYTENVHLQDLIQEAYGVEDNRIAGLPEWGKSPGGTVYEVAAKAEGEAIPTPEHLQELLQSLLADRFHLILRRETKPNVAVFAVVAGKDGVKFHEFHQDENAAPPAPGGPRPFTGTTIFALMDFLKRYVDAPVVDRTGLPAVAYDFDINTMLDFKELASLRTDHAAAQDYVLSAVREKLGIRIESRKESMELLVIDHVEEPTPN